MFKIIRGITLFSLVLALLGCNQDPCDVAHTIIDGECIPDYIFPPNENLQFGDRFYHPKFGVIVFKNGKWYDDHDKHLKELNTKRN